MTRANGARNPWGGPSSSFAEGILPLGQPAERVRGKSQHAAATRGLFAARSGLGTLYSRRTIGLEPGTAS